MHIKKIHHVAESERQKAQELWNKHNDALEAGAEGPYTVYSLDDETGRVSKDGVYPTWRKAYAALTDGTVWDEGSSNNFVFHGNHLQQIYKYKKTGRTGKWSGNGYDVIFDREISEDPAAYIKAHFTQTRYNSCRFNESKKSETAPDDYARDSFLEDALDYAEIKDDNGNVILLKFYKNKYNDDFKLDSYDGENQKTLAAGGLRYVVDRYGELLDMESAEAIIAIAKE